MRTYKGRKRQTRGSVRREYPFYPNQLLRILMVIMGTLAAVAVLSALFPLSLDLIADPFARPEAGTRALWILKPVILLGGMLKRPGLTIVLVTFLAALFVLLPALDRSGQRTLKRRLLMATPFLLWVLFLAVSLLFSVGVPG